MTKEEAKNYLVNYRKLYEDFAPEKFLEALDIILSEPSLPSNMDDAAKQYARNYTESDTGNGGDDWEDDIQITFKAGAKWMAAQGYIDHCAVIQETRDYGDGYTDITFGISTPDEPFDENAEYIFQIRKK